jgi:hypothetical protein|tara:strand:+ start:2390 stop:2725 length:336 start_codon:yes stop_codon:yes gene_type:complete
VGLPFTGGPIFLPKLKLHGMLIPQAGEAGLAEITKISSELRHELGDLITAFCWYADHGEAAKIPELFTEDGRISAPETYVVGDSYETFEKGSDGQWRFAERRLDLTFKADS